MSPERFQQYPQPQFEGGFEQPGGPAEMAPPGMNAYNDAYSQYCAAQQGGPQMAQTMQEYWPGAQYGPAAAAPGAVPDNVFQVPNGGSYPGADQGGYSGQYGYGLDQGAPFYSGQWGQGGPGQSASWNGQFSQNGGPGSWGDQSMEGQESGGQFGASGGPSGWGPESMEGQGSWSGGQGYGGNMMGNHWRHHGGCDMQGQPGMQQGDPSNLMVEKMLSDPTLTQELQTAASQVSPQGMTGFMNIVEQNLSADPYVNDNTLMWQSVQQAQQSGMNNQDASMIESVLSAAPTPQMQQISYGSPTYSTANGGSDPIVNQAITDAQTALPSGNTMQPVSDVTSTAAATNPTASTTGADTSTVSSALASLASQLDAPMQQLLSDAQAHMSQQGQTVMAQLIAQDLQANPGMGDAQLMQMVLQQANQAGMSADDQAIMQGLVQKDISPASSTSTSNAVAPATGDTSSSTQSSSANSSTGNDPVFNQVVTDSQSNLSQQGFSQFQQLVQKELQANPTESDATLFQNVITQAQSAGMSSTDLTALQNLVASDVTAGSSSTGSQTTNPISGSTANDVTGSSTNGTGTSTGAASALSALVTAAQSDSTLHQALNDASSQLSQQGFLQLAQILNTSLTSNPNIGDATLFQNALQQAQSAGMSQTDQTALQNVIASDVTQSSSTSGSSNTGDTSLGTATTSSQTSIPSTLGGGNTNGTSSSSSTSFGSPTASSSTSLGTSSHG